MKDLARLYDTFTPIERVRLFTEAAARRDIAELDRLNNTRPRKLYRAEDWEYSRLKIDLYVLALAQSGDRAKFEILACFALAVIVATENDDDNEEQSTTAVSLFTTALTTWRAKTEAWSRFCRQIGIEPETAAKAHGLAESPFVQIIESIAESLGLATGPDAKKVADEVAALNALWDRQADSAG